MVATLEDLLAHPERYDRKARLEILAVASPTELKVASSLVDLALNKPRRRFYCSIPECDGRPHVGFHWCDHPIDSDDHLPTCRHARASQRPPAGDWFVWLFSGGRGTGKTRAGAEWVLDQVWNKGSKRIALVARTPADARDVMIYGDSGIMACSDPHPRPEHEPTKRRLVWPNGAQAFTYAAWCDELAAWPDAVKGDSLDTSWNNLMLGLRIGHDPKAFVTTTPKRVKLIRQIMERSTSITTTDTTYANLMNLAPSFRDQVLAAYEGTRIGRQELYGELLTDVEGALWNLEQIDRLRVEWTE